MNRTDRGVITPTEQKNDTKFIYIFYNYVLRNLLDLPFVFYFLMYLLHNG